MDLNPHNVSGLCSARYSCSTSAVKGAEIKGPVSENIWISPLTPRQFHKHSICVPLEAFPREGQGILTGNRSAGPVREEGRKYFGCIVCLRHYTMRHPLSITSMSKKRTLGHKPVPT